MLRSAVPWLIAGLLVLLVSGAVVAGGQAMPFAARSAPTSTASRVRSTETLTNGNLRDAIDAPERFANALVEVTGRVAGTQIDSSTGSGTFLITPDPPAGVMVAVEPPIGRAPASPGTMIRVHGILTHVGTAQLGGGGEARVPYVIANEVEVLAFEETATPATEPSATAEVTPPAETPVSSDTPLAGETPTDEAAKTEPEATPAESPTPEASPIVEDTATPEVSPIAEDTATSEASPIVIVEATATPGASPTPVSSPTPEVTLIPAATATSMPAATAITTAAPTAAPSPTRAIGSPTPGPTPSAPVVKLQSADGGKVEARFAVAEMARGPGFASADAASGGDGGAVVTGETNQDWNGRGPAPSGGEARMNVDVPIGGEYAVWVRMRYHDLEANSVWLRVDNGQIYKVGNDDSGYGTWKWVGWSDGDPNKRVVVRLDPGQHAITLVSREAGTAIDSILVTSDTKVRP